jgi:hypothetical protein
MVLIMQENPFSDSVPTHLAIAATVYTKPLMKLEDETKTNRSKLIFVVGGYGNGKSHAMERLKNDININEETKLAIYSSAYATKSLRQIYEQICGELLAGKIKKLKDVEGARVLMESKGIPEKVVELLLRITKNANTNEVREELRFGKTIASSPDVINFVAALSLLVEQLLVLIDDIEEAVSMEKAERKAFLGHIRALYDQAVRIDSNLFVVLTLTPEKLEMVKADRPDLHGRVDRMLYFEKPTLREVAEIVEKRLEITGLDNIKIKKNVVEAIWNGNESIRDIINALRDVLDKAFDEGKTVVDRVEIKRRHTRIVETFEEIEGVEGVKPADEDIIKVLREKEGLRAEEIVEKSGKSGSWIRHRLADLVKAGVLTKEQKARNAPALYYLAEKSTKEGNK